MTSRGDRFRGRLSAALVGAEPTAETPTSTRMPAAPRTDPQQPRPRFRQEGRLLVGAGSSGDKAATSTTATGPSFVAAYTMKDVLLYALAVGYGDVTNTSGSGSVDMEERRHGRPSLQQQYEQDLRHVYEGHPRFSVLPTFGLALPFLATISAKEEALVASAFGEEGAAPGTLPAFPPPFLRHLLGDHLLSQRTPILHTWQSIAWTYDAPDDGDNNYYHDDETDEGAGKARRTCAWQVPLRNDGVALATVSTWVESIVDASAASTAASASAAATPPRSKEGNTPPASTSSFSSASSSPGKGATWVTARTVVWQEQRALCEMRAKFLVVGRRGHNGGVDGSTVRGAHKRTGHDRIPSSSPSTPTSSSSRAELPAPFTWETSWRVGWNAALLYRLGSGDTNSIHVVGIPSPNNKTRPPRVPMQSETARDHLLKVERPIVHGLCTMGHVARILEQHYEDDSTCRQPDQGGAQERSPAALDVEWRRLECRFVNPVHVGDELHVRVREEVRRRESPRVSVGTSVEVTFCVYKTIVGGGGGGGDGGGDGHLHLHGHGHHAVVVVVDRGYAALVVRIEDTEDGATGTKVRATTPRSCALGPTSKL